MSHNSTQTRGTVTPTGTTGTVKRNPRYPRYPLPPVIGVDVYRQDTVIRRQKWLHRGPMTGGGIRKEVTRFSKASRARLAFVAGNTDVEFCTLITLTYPREYPSDGRTVKQHLNAFLTWYRRQYPGTSYLWFLEFQKRGAPHVHIMTTVPLPCVLSQKARVYNDTAQKWYDLVASRDKRHLAAGTRVERIRKRDGARRYCVKYAGKMEQKTVPSGYRNVGRFWGCSRDVPPKPIASMDLDDDTARSILKDWPYYRGDDFPLYHTLYNTSPRFLEFIDRMIQLDIATNWQYNRVRRDSARGRRETQNGKEVTTYAKSDNLLERQLRTYSPEGGRD